MRFLPCRVCGNPVNGSISAETKSFCCSSTKCTKKDTGIDTDEPTIIFTDKKWKAKINWLTRGY
jgi:endogenous inhibitor of DNA gyrase (YacG/DUF329 family)